MGPARGLEGFGAEALGFGFAGIGDSGGEGCLRSGLDLASGVWSSGQVLGVEEFEFAAHAAMFSILW